MSESMVLFSMAVNDEYGQHSGKLRAAVFQSNEFDNQLHVECVGREMTVRHLIGKAAIRLGRTTFPITNYGTWVGNMSWDAAYVPFAVANQIADLLRKSGQYAPTDGATDLWDAWEAGIPLFSADSSAVLAQAGQQQREAGDETARETGKGD